MITQTSLQSYYNEVLPNIGKNQQIILETLKSMSSASNMMIADKLGWSINRVTPRINELRKLGLVVEFKIDYCLITHRNVSYWGIFNES